MGTCRKCGGTGRVHEPAVDLSKPDGEDPRKLITLPCPECHGTGNTRDPEELDV